MGPLFGPKGERMSGGQTHALNRRTRLTTAVLGVTYAVAGLHHGFFETLQGNRPTDGIGIASIGPDQLRWEYGTDDAITLIPNFLATGVAAMLVSVAIILWSMFFLQRRHGSTVFLSLFILLTLVGGGVGHVVFFLAAWGYATRMRRPLTWWGRVLGPTVRQRLERAWIPALAGSCGLFLLGLEMSVFGLGLGGTDPDTMLVVIWGVLLGSLALQSVAYVGAFARDLGPFPLSAQTGRGAAKA